MMKTPRSQLIALIVLGVFLLAAACFGIAHGIMKSADKNGKVVTYSQCTVYDIESKRLTRGKAHKPHHYVDSSCGYFETSEEIANSLEADSDYDWSATQGNWANKPTIVTIDSSY